jgi:hypothetical protein
VPSTFYQEILAVQSLPYSLGLDDSSRVRFACNYEIIAHSPLGGLFELEIATLLNSSGGLVSLPPASGPSPVFFSPASLIPPALTGPATAIVSTGGSGPREFHSGSKLLRLSCQIVVVAKDDAARTLSDPRGHVAAYNRAVEIWHALDGKRNLTVTT